MDLSDLTQRVEALRRRYVDVRELRTDVRDQPAGKPLPPWLLERCRRLAPEAPAEERDELQAFLDDTAGELADALSDAREAQWDQQGRMLRYALVMLQNRVQSLRAETAAGAEAAEADMLRRLDEQVHDLRQTIGQWQDSRRQADVCSLEQIAAFVEDPYHEGDKEELDGILSRGRAAGLPEDLVCVELVWDGVSGRVESARLIPKERRRVA